MDRHSLFVRVLRLVLPLVGLGLLLAVFLLPRELLTGSIGLTGVTVDPEGGLRLVNPRFAGETADGLPFSVTAEWALPDAPDPTEVQLGDLEGEILIDSGETLRLKAARGEYRPQDRLLTLDGGIVLTTSDGYRMTAEAARADIGRETLSLDGPVSGQGALGAIDAASMRAENIDGARYIWFEGGVRVTIEPVERN